MIKDGKRKIYDGEKQRESWRQGTTGFNRDWDGDPVATSYNRKDMKRTPTKSVHMAKPRKPKPEEY